MSRGVMYARAALSRLTPGASQPVSAPRQFSSCLCRGSWKRSIPVYRYELENSLLFGRLRRRPRRAASAADAPPPPPPAVTVVSETGYVEGGAGAPPARGPAAPGYLYPPGQRLPPPGQRLPSVTRVLQATMSEESRAALRRWEAAMVEKHGHDGFAAIKQGYFSTGQALHAAVHGHLRGCLAEDALPAAAEGFWRSVRPVLGLVDCERLTAAEMEVTHAQLGYTGVVDCVAPFRSCPMVIEWKTARRPKDKVEDLYDNPVQAAAYLGAYNFMHRKAQVKRAAVVVAYESGRPATVHVLSPDALRLHWAAWLRRLRLYRRTVAAA